MNAQPTASEGREALRDHLLARALEARQRYGPAIDADAVLAMLNDRRHVRHPTALCFDDEPLAPGEFAWPVPHEATGGYRLHVHPALERRRELWPAVVAYYLPLINYGPIVDHDDCLCYGAALLDLSPAEFEGTLRGLAVD